MPLRLVQLYKQYAIVQHHHHQLLLLSVYYNNTDYTREMERKVTIILVIALCCGIASAYRRDTRYPGYNRLNRGNVAAAEYEPGMEY